MPQARLGDIVSVASGPTEPGNVDLYRQPRVTNPDGSVSTVDSRSYNIDGREMLLPSVTPDGRHLQSDDDILSEYRKTGRHLGAFATPEEATSYASQLHDDYAAGKYDRSSGRASLTDIVSVEPETKEVPKHPYAILGEGVARGIKDRALGGWELLKATGFGGVLPPTITGEQAKAIGQGLKETPGKIWEEVTHPVETLKKDPIALVEDTLMLGGLGKLGLRGAQALKVPAKLKATGGAAIESTMKPRLSMRQKNPDLDFGQVMAREGISPSAKGVEKLQQGINAEKAAKKVAQDAAVAAGKEVDVVEAIGPAVKELREAAQTPGVSQSDLRGMASELRNFLEHPELKGKRAAAIPAIERSKQHLGQATAGLRGKVAPIGTKRMQDALRVGERQALETAVPDIASANKRMSELIPLKKELQWSINRGSNRNPLSLPSLLTGALTGGATGDLGSAAMATLLHQVAASPRGMALAGRTLWRLGQGMERGGAGASSLARTGASAAPALTSRVVEDFSSALPMAANSATDEGQEIYPAGWTPDEEQQFQEWMQAFPDEEPGMSRVPVPLAPGRR